MIFLCAKVPGWLEKYWLSAQPLVLEEAGRTCRCEGGRADGNRWRWAATGQGHAAGAVHGSVLPGGRQRMSSGRVVQGKNRGESGPAGKAVPCALVKADAGKGQGWRRRRPPGRADSYRPALEQACGEYRSPPGCRALGRMARGGKGPLCAGQRGLFPDRPGGRARQWLAAPRRHRQRCGRGSSSVSRHCGVSEGAQSGARSSKAV